MVELLSDISRDWSLRSLDQIYYPYSFFNAKLLFQKVDRFLKKERAYFINLVLSPWRSETTRKTSLWIEKFQNVYYFKSRKSYHKLRLALL